MPFISCNIKHLCEGNMSKKDTGLGNTLYQIATQYAFSREFNMTMDLRELRIYVNKLRDMGFDHDDNIFKLLFTLFDKKEDTYPNVSYKLLSEEHNKGEIFDKNFKNSVKQNKDTDIKINGYMQSFLYFDHYRAELYRMFQPSHDFIQYAEVQYPELFDKDTVTVSVHVRMNYANVINYKEDFFIECMEYFKSKYENKRVHFFVFSNNHEEIQGWFSKYASSYTSVTGNQDYMDLWLMTMCNHNIISHSTFAWWGAYLNCHPDKEVYYPYDSLRVWWGQLLPSITCPEREYEHFLPEWKSNKTDTMYLYS